MESDTYGFCFVLIKMGLKEAEDKRTLEILQNRKYWRRLDAGVSWGECWQ